jgi:uncharacterized heparinase superfamily protein
MATGRLKRPRAPAALVWEALQVSLRRWSGGFRRWRRRCWFYRRLLKGQLCDRIAIPPHDALPRRLEDADALLRGRFRFEGETVTVKEGSVFDLKPPSHEWQEALEGFTWLPPLSMAGGDAARLLATNLIAQWVKRNPRYREPSWLPQVMARRLIHVFAHGRFVVLNSDLMWRSKLFVSLREQSKMLARTAHEAPDGIGRIEAAVALAMSGICLEDCSTRLGAGLQRLEVELARQILPDGGHISRSPEVLLSVYRLLVMLCDLIAAAGFEVPKAVRNAHDRIAPMIRFFRHGDGALAVFQGGSENSAKMIAGLLAHDDAHGQPFAYARFSGYHRLVAGHALALFDCGKPPPGAFSVGAHAGCLAFEFGTGSHRIVVNCGSAVGIGQHKWESALRATAAHSTLTLADTSNAVVLHEGWLRRKLGARLYGGPQEIVARRSESENGWTVTAGHDAYAEPFGVRHERSLTMSPQGLALTGVDRLVPVPLRKGRAMTVNFAIRFHIHPDVRLSRAQGGDVLLKLPNGEGWRFRTGAPIAFEESVYLGGGVVRRTEQLVLTGSVSGEPVEIAWIFEQIKAAG